MINITVLDMEPDSRLSEMPKPKYICTDSWNIPVVGQEDYVALRAHAELLQTERDEKDKQLATCYDRMNKAEAQRDLAVEALEIIKECFTTEAMFSETATAAMTARMIKKVLKECGE